MAPVSKVSPAADVGHVFVNPPTNKSAQERDDKQPTGQATNVKRRTFPFHSIYSFGYISPHEVVLMKFTIALVLTIVVGVKLLWSVGDEEMGGVLGSGVTPVKKHS
jgi:hypothetical protein